MSFRKFHKNLQIRIITQFFTQFASMMVLPFLAIYFSQQVGNLLTGIMSIIVVISGVIGGILGGYFADQYGRKNVMFLSELGMAIAFLFVAFFNSHWITQPYLTFVFILLSMFCGGVFAPTAQAMILDVTDTTSRRYVFSLTYWMNNLSLGLAGIIGAFLFEKYLFFLFLSISAISFFSSIITYYLIEETHFIKKEDSLEASKQSIFHSYIKVFRDRVFLLFLLASILVQSLQEQVTNFIGIRMANTINEQPFLTMFNLNLSIDGIRLLGILRSENTFLVVILGGIIAALTKKEKNRTILTIGISIYSIGFGFLAFSKSPWLLIVMMFMATLGEIMYVPVRQTMLGDLAPETSRSAYLAANQFTFYIAMLIAGLDVIIGGFIPTWLMGIKYTIFGLISLAIFLIIDYSKEKGIPLIKAMLFF